MEGHRPTREEIVEYMAQVIRKEGPLSKGRQEEVLLEAIEDLSRKKEKEACRYH
jgi:hypothetical protein